MPVAITTLPANAPAIADTPEFKELQKQLGQAKAIISSIDQQIIAIASLNLLESTQSSRGTIGDAGGTAPIQIDGDW